MPCLANLRRDYKLLSLDERNMTLDPMVMFKRWMEQAISYPVLEANAMNLATCSQDGRISLRTVLLKDITDEGFVFFTNYESRKGQELFENENCALNFCWLELERQVRIEGHAEKISPEKSDFYFEARPSKSKLGAWASPQSKVIPNREYLISLMSEFEEKYKGETVLRPENWGGYVVKPDLIEFWQGRSNRLHDRIQYRLENEKWIMERLAP